MTSKTTHRPHSRASAEAMALLNQIFQAEMAGIIRYMHYSFMIMGHNRIPIQAWFRTNATESMTHAVTIGEKITSLGGHPPLIAAKVDEYEVHTVDQLLKETAKFEEEALSLYKKLAKQAAQDDDIALEEMAREFVRLETEDLDEVYKMIREYA